MNRQRFEMFLETRGLSFSRLAASPGRCELQQLLFHQFVMLDVATEGEEVQT